MFPPISVRDWTVETLSDRIAEVRQLYVDTLADWPIDELPDHDVYRKKAPRKIAKAAPAKAAAKKAAPAKAARRRLPAKAEESCPRESRGEENGQGDPAQGGAAQSDQGPTEYASAKGAIVTPGCRRGFVQHHRRHPGVGVGVVADGIGIACHVAGSATCPPSGNQARGAAAARAGRVTRRDGATRRATRIGRGPVDRAGASLLDAAGRRVGMESGGGVDPGPKSLPAQRTSAAPHSAHRPFTRPGGGWRVGQGVRTSSAVARHHRRRQPA